MRNCLLCNKNPADKKGSHIVPHFLIKRIDNEEGETGRDKELGFVITPRETTSYFGRAILPEKLEEIYGEVTGDLIDDNIIEGIVDHYFCARCESNLSIIESDYSGTLSQNPELNKNYESSASGIVSFLFWISIIWRLSVQENSGFKLKLKEEKKLNRILKKYLGNDLDKIKPNPLDSDLINIGYKLLRSPHFSDDNYTWLHWQPTYSRPYTIMIDEFVLFLYFKKSHLNGMTMDFYKSEYLKKKAQFNIPSGIESIFSVTHNEFLRIVENINNYAAKVMDKELDKNLDKIFQHLGAKGKMNLKLKLEIKRDLAESKIALGKKFTIKHQAEIIEEVILKYANR